MMKPADLSAEQKRLLDEAKAAQENPDDMVEYKRELIGMKPAEEVELKARARKLLETILGVPQEYKEATVAHAIEQAADTIEALQTEVNRTRRDYIAAKDAAGDEIKGWRQRAEAAEADLAKAVDIAGEEYRARMEPLRKENEELKARVAALERILQAALEQTMGEANDGPWREVARAALEKEFTNRG